MKTTFFKFLSFVFFTSLMVSCGGSDDSPAPTPPPTSSVTSITLSVSGPATVVVGDNASFVVRNNFGAVVTSSTTITVNGVVATNPYTFTAPGDYQIVATMDDLTSNTVTRTAVQATSIDLKAPAKLVVGTEATFEVVNDLGVNVTDEATYTLDGTAITNPHTFATEGTFELVAMHDGLTSSAVNVEVVPEESYSATGAPATYTKKILISDFTGTWCQFCPIAGEAVKNATNNNSNVLAIAFHNGDSMANSDSNAVDNHFNVTSYPTVLLNGSESEWTYPSMPESELNTLLAIPADLGLGIETEEADGNVFVSVKVGYKTALSNLKLTVSLIEDGFVAPQSNSISSLGTTPTISNYVHDDILRKSYTASLGDAISSSYIAVGGVYTKNFSFAMPSVVDNASNTRIIAYITDSNDKVLNIQNVEVGSTVDFD